MPVTALRFTDDQARARGIDPNTPAGTVAKRSKSAPSQCVAATPAKAGGAVGRAPHDKRRKPRLPNKTEARFRDEYFSPYGHWNGLFIARYEYESIALNYGSESDPAWYRADWVVWMSLAEETSYGVPAAPLVYVEVKGGHVYPAARERFMAATGRYPELTFLMFQSVSIAKPWECLHASGPLVEIFI